MNLAIWISLEYGLMCRDNLIAMNRTNFTEFYEPLEIGWHHRQLTVERTNRFIIEWIQLAFSWRDSPERRDRNLHEPLTLHRIGSDVQDFRITESLNKRKCLFLCREDNVLILAEWECKSSTLAKFLNLGVLLCVCKRHALVVTHLILLRKGDWTTIEIHSFCVLC